MEAQVSGTDVLQVQPAALASVDILPLNASARTAAVTPGLSPVTGITATPCFVVLDDAWRGTGHLADVFEGMQQPCFGLHLLQVWWTFYCLGNRLNSHAAFLVSAWDDTKRFVDAWSALYVVCFSRYALA